MPFLEEGARRVDTLFHFERKARVASIPSSISGKGRASTKWIVFPPSSISGGGRALHRYPPPFLEEGARRVDTLLHFWRRACVASIPSSISGGGRASTKWMVFPRPTPFREEGAARRIDLPHFGRRVQWVVHLHDNQANRIGKPRSNIPLNIIMMILFPEINYGEMNEKSRAGGVLLCSISVTHGMGLKYPYMPVEPSMCSFTSVLLTSHEWLLLRTKSQNCPCRGSKSKEKEVKLVLLK